MSQSRMIQSYVIFNRHGHRAPARNVFSSLEESVSWGKYLVNKEILQELDFVNPVEYASERIMAKDLKTFPFGCLTSKGMQHLVNKGVELTKCFPLLKKPSQSLVFATNYQRTQVSAQALMNGIGISSTPVQVKSAIDCPMSFYEGRRDVALNQIKRAEQSESYRQLRAMSRETRDNLARLLPALNSGHVIGASGGTFESIDWAAAFDYFTCHRAHDLPVRPDLLKYEDSVMHYFISRYRIFFSDPLHLASFSAPLLSAVVEAARKSCPPAPEARDSIDQGPTVTIFSGHDVTLFGLLYALRAEVVHGKSPLDPVLYWPYYGSTLVFEITQRNNRTFLSSDGTLAATATGNVGPVTSADTADDSGVEVNVYLDMKPLRLHVDTVEKGWQRKGAVGAKLNDSASVPPSSSSALSGENVLKGATIEEGKWSSTVSLSHLTRLLSESSDLTSLL